jgi:hypothetical protein
MTMTNKDFITLMMDFTDENGPDVNIIDCDIIGDCSGDDDETREWRILATKGNTLVYDYGNQHFACQFNTMAEVGEPYQPWFKDALKRHNITMTPGSDGDCWTA